MKTHHTPCGWKKSPCVTSPLHRPEVQAWLTGLCGLALTLQMATLASDLGASEETSSRCGRVLGGMQLWSRMEVPISSLAVHPSCPPLCSWRSLSTPAPPSSVQSLPPVESAPQTLPTPSRSGPLKTMSSVPSCSLTMGGPGQHIHRGWGGGGWGHPAWPGAAGALQASAPHLYSQISQWDVQ